MKSQEKNMTDKLEPTGVQHDSETPFAKKPSVLYITSIILGVSVIIFLAANAYYGIIGS